MNFTKAIDILVGDVSHKTIAKAAGVSVQSIRQARLDPQNANYRSPPRVWKETLARLALARSRELAALVKELESAS